MTTPAPPALATELTLVPLYATWIDYKHGGLKPGTAKILTTTRLTTTIDSVIIPAGTWWEGPLATSGERSLDVLVPATDDPAIRETGWTLTIIVLFDDGTDEEYYEVNVPHASKDWSAPGVDLRNRPVKLAPRHRVPGDLRVGEPGGVAIFEPDGSLLNPITHQPIVGTPDGGMAVDTTHPFIITN